MEFSKYLAFDKILECLANYITSQKVQKRIQTNEKEIFINKHSGGKKTISKFVTTKETNLEQSKTVSLILKGWGGKMHIEEIGTNPAKTGEEKNPVTAYTSSQESHQKVGRRDFPSGPVVKNLPSSAGASKPACYNY